MRLTPSHPIVVVALLAASWLPWPAASRATSTLPDEESFRLRSTATAALVGDTDGDGVRELVVIGPGAEGSGMPLAIEVLAASDGGLLPGGQVQLRRRAGGEDLLRHGVEPDEDGMLPMARREPARLLSWHVDGRERVLALTIGSQGLPYPCCLTPWQVIRNADGRTGLRELPGLLGGGVAVVLIDLDADGTDELVIGDPVIDGSFAVRIFRWDGRWRPIDQVELASESPPSLMPLGDTDGAPGEEVGILASQAGLLRIGLDSDDGLVRDQIRSWAWPMPAGLPTEEGPRLAVVTQPAGIGLANWPRGGRFRLQAQTSRSGRLLGVLGSGESVRMIVEGSAGQVDLLDGTLGVLPSPGQSLPARLFEGSGREPYVGPLPGGLPDGRAAFISRGRLIAGGGETIPIGALPGVSPVGAFGERLAWTALTSEPSLDVTLHGGPLASGSPAGATVTVVPTASFLIPEVDEESYTPTVRDAVIVGQSGSRQTLLTAGSISLDVNAPRGSLLILTNGEDDPRQDDVIRSGPAALRLSPPSALRDRSGGYAGRLSVITPAGHAYQSVFQVQVLRDPPPVLASTPFVSFGLDVSLSGRTSPGSEVFVDGRPVAVADDGTFEAAVGAGIVPREVAIRAVDVVGNTSTQTVSVVAPIDYRRLPWVPIVAGLTLVAAVILFLRVPRPSGVRHRVSTDQGTFEEIE